MGGGCAFAPKAALANPRNSAAVGSTTGVPSMLVSELPAQAINTRVVTIARVTFDSDHVSFSPSGLTQSNRISPMRKSTTNGVTPKRCDPVIWLVMAIRKGAMKEVALPESA